jgi:hypothetical protein
MLYAMKIKFVRLLFKQITLFKFNAQQNKNPNNFSIVWGWFGFEN